jgi:hypothetical protein
MGGVGFIPDTGGVSNEGVTHGRAAFIPCCSQEVGVSGEVPEYVDGFVETAIGMELNG